MTTDEPAASADRTARPTRGVSGFALAVLVLVASIFLVIFAWRAAVANAQDSARAEFAAKCDEVTDLLRQRMVHYELTIRGGAALFASVDHPSPAQWQAYVDGLDLPTRFPSLAGLGYAKFVTHYGLERLQMETRAAGRGLLTIFPRGVREFYAPILYLEPKTAENLSAVGFDMYSDPSRHAAMEAAWRDAAPRMTGRVRLLQDLDPRAASLVLYAPVFRGGAAPETVPQRHAALVGWVYAPVRMTRFVERALQPIRRDFTFRLLDVSDATPAVLHEETVPAVESPAFRETRDLSAYGRTWRLEFASSPVDEAVPALGPLRTALVVGLLASSLLFGIAWSLAYTEAHAQRLAAHMTVAARRSEARVRALNRSLEARVETRTRELSEANRELEAFAYSVSHDLRAPLRAIEGFGRVLEDRYESALDDTGRGYLRRVRNAAARMSELIESLLKVSRVTRGALNIEPLDLTRLAEDVVAELRAAEPERMVEMAIQPGLNADGDRVLVRSLLQNLLGNAWKFTRDRVDARIVFGRDGKDRAFFVQDNGIGFEQTYVDKLFRPFQRLHDDAHFVGEGIGLATVKRIVERHGGTIQAQGRPGQGAVFTFTLGPVTR